MHKRVSEIATNILKEISNLLTSFPSNHAIAVGAIYKSVTTEDDIIGILLSMTSNDYSKNKHQCLLCT